MTNESVESDVSNDDGDEYCWMINLSQLVQQLEWNLIIVILWYQWSEEVNEHILARE